MRRLSTIVAIAAGALGAIGCVIAALFERDGFGRPRDTEPRVWYLLLVSIGLIVCVAAPAWIGAAVWGRRFAVGATVVAVLVGLAMFGLTA